MSERPKTYRERLTQSPEDKKNKELELQIEESKDQLRNDIRATKREIASIEKQIDGLKSQKPLPVDKIIALEGRLINHNNGLAALKKLKGELFPKEEATTAETV